MEDCGVTYFQEEKKVDPYQLIASEGANIIRLRI
jgi:arabinogalactan endo-1,4-beta-galactosidase